jgi:hypothetical protein
MITNVIDGMIKTQNPLMMATYHQAEGDSLYRYTFNLYKDGVLMQNSGVLTDGLLQYQFNNIENKTNYVIELKVETSSGMTNSIQLEFYSIYLQTKMPAVMKLEPDPKTGSVIIKTYIRQILGRIYSGDDINYIDGEWADLHNTIVIWDSDSAFRLDGNWTAKIWARDLEDNDVMLVRFLLDDNNYIELTKYHNMFSLTKIVSGIKLYELHSFVTGDILSTDVLFFYIQNDVNLGLMNFSVQRVTEGRNTWFTQSYSDDVAPTYASENGFLTFLPEKFTSLFLDNTIDGVNQKVYIPTLDDILNADTSSILGKSTLGTMILGNTSNFDITTNKSYFTRTIDSTDTNKLKIINANGVIATSYPNSELGIRFVIKITNNTKISTYMDLTDNCHFFALNISNLFTLQNIVRV